MRRAAALLAVAAALAGCQSSRVCTPAGAAAAAPPAPDWRDAASDTDHVKLRGARSSFLNGLAAARAAGFAAPIAAAGRLYDPDYAEDGVALPAGRYTCRAVTLGSKTAGRPAYVAEPARTCTVDQDRPVPRFFDEDGAQRLAGRIYPDGPARAVFLGTVAMPDEATALRYGRDADRDRVALVERVGPSRWRMTIADPPWEAPVEVIEITQGD